MVDDAYTKALLHFTGADESTTFTDESGKVWTRNGNAKIDTAQWVFGPTSGYFDGTGDYIDTPDSDDFNVGSGDFTVDFWIRFAQTTVTNIVYGQVDSSFTTTTASMTCWLNGASKRLVGLIYNSAGTSKTAQVATNIDVDTWYHHAMIRNGNNLYVALNGVLSSATDVTGFTVNNNANKFTIGRGGEYAAETMNGWIDEFRFSKGIARWTSNFTPPRYPYGISSRRASGIYISDFGVA